ncbi:MAG: hypothetical protein PF440_02125 [Thiomicrorhabdus sp.]|jgi:Ala-tRNA(Pro) deacylase|nr:hypothetical protein [Thiomicrorhabdus sp.]
MVIAHKLLAYLNHTNTVYETVAHPKTFSNHETADATHLRADHFAKGVLLKDLKGYLLAVIPGNEWLDLKRLGSELNRELQLLSESEMQTLFNDCKPGAIPPFGEVYGIETVVDQSLLSLSKVYFEAGDHEQLIVVSGEQFQMLVKGLRHGYFCKQV